MARITHTLYYALRELLAAACHDCWHADFGGTCARPGHQQARAALAEYERLEGR